MKAIIFALYATEFNICWFRSYDILKIGVQKLRESYRQLLENEKSTTKDANSERIKRLVYEDIEADHFWDASDIGSMTNIPDLNEKLAEFTACVDN